MVAELKEALSRCASALGFAVIPNWRLEQRAEADFVSRLFRLLEIDCVLDVGANLGQYRDFLRKHARFDGYIISFEPIPQHVEFLRNRAKTDSRWVVQGYALGSASGRASFNVMASTAFSSFLSPSHERVPEFKGQNEIREKVDVEVRVLDDVLPELEGQLGARRLFLKLDTQGFDLEVIKGANQTIERIRGLQTEASIKPIYSSMPDYVTTIRTLQSLGFEPSNFFPVNPDQFPALIEVDCYMVSKRYLV